MIVRPWVHLQSPRLLGIIFVGSSLHSRRVGQAEGRVCNGVPMILMKEPLAIFIIAEPDFPVLFLSTKAVKTLIIL